MNVFVTITIKPVRIRLPYLAYEQTKRMQRIVLYAVAHNHVESNEFLWLTSFNIGIAWNYHHAVAALKHMVKTYDQS